MKATVLFDKGYFGGKIKVNYKETKSKFILIIKRHVKLLEI